MTSTIVNLATWREAKARRDRRQAQLAADYRAPSITRLSGRDLYAELAAIVKAEEFAALTDWEIGFLRSIADIHAKRGAGALSPKQRSLTAKLIQNVMALRSCPEEA